MSISTTVLSCCHVVLYAGGKLKDKGVKHVENEDKKPDEPISVDTGVTPPPDESADPLAPPAGSVAGPAVVTPVQGAKPPKKGVPKKILIPIIILLLVAVAAALYFFVFKKDSKAADSTTKQTSQKSEDELNEDAAKKYDEQIARLTDPKTGEKWHETLQPIASPGYEPTLDSANADFVSYYEAGTHGDNKIIMRNEASFDAMPQLFERAPDGTVSVIIHPNANGNYDKQYDPTAESFKAGIKIDSTTHYDSLSTPDYFALEQGETAFADGDNTYLGQLLADGGGKPASGYTVTTVKQYGGSTLQKTSGTNADTGLTTITYWLKTPINTSVNLRYEPFGDDLKNITWDDGSTASGKFGGIVRGCGATGYWVSHAVKLSDADFVKAGDYSGLAVYNFASNDNSMFKKAYDEFKENYSYATADNKDASTEDKAKAKMSLDDYKKVHAVFAGKSPNTGWLIFTADGYSLSGGCAKPVVYLYPTTPTTVSVKVGADVKISDPLYDPATGWHAFAWPNGNLIVNGQAYTSLFWEGPGHGAYPAITSGTVVKRADAVATIRKQLVQQGLNQQETNDFMDYWTDKIPDKPYVRLAWFNTAQMDELAPLQISPKPTTVIRVFLDMAGYDAPVSMPQQHLTAIPRTGFTAVEWGGLSLGKLY